MPAASFAAGDDISSVHWVNCSLPDFVVIVDCLLVVCRRRDHPHVPLTGSACQYSRRRSILRCRRSASLLAAAVAACRRAGRPCRCLAAASPSPSPPPRPRGGRTASDGRAPTSSRPAASPPTAVPAIRSRRLGRAPSAPSRLATNLRRRRRRLRSQPAWRSVTWSPTFRRRCEEFTISIRVCVHWWTNWQLLLTCLRFTHLVITQHRWAELEEE